MDEDQNICRVCRSGPTVTQPLFHPCKCSGSIRFVHQECLIQWLSHSKKKYCELCEHHFVFTPIYRDDMPSKLPFRVIFTKLATRISSGCILLFRTLLAVLVWLFLIPTLTLWIWRFYFWSGGNIGFSPGPSLNDTNDTHQNAEDNQNSLFNYYWREILSDCFQGLFITVFVVVVFVAAYLFREWVIQNTVPNPEHVVNEEEEEDNSANRFPILMNEQPVIEQHYNRSDANQQEIHEDTTEPANRNEIEQIVSRLEELRRNIERRRGTSSDSISSSGRFRRDEIDAQSGRIEYNHNPYATSGSTLSPGLAGYYPMSSSNNRSRRDNSTDDTLPNGDDIFVNPPSEVQTPFWRDYQQARAQQDADNGPESSSQHIQNETLNNNSTWRARDFSAPAITERNDYFAEQFLDETVLLDENDQSLNNNGGRPLVPEIQPPAENEEINNNNNDMPFDIAEDIDGILEAVGLRGNILLLLKNSILMLLMINLCLCVVVWIPYVIGRTFISICAKNLLGSPYVTNTARLILNYTIIPIYASIVNLSRTLLPALTLTAINATKESILSSLYFIFKSIDIALLDPTGNGLALFLSDTTKTNTSWELIKDNLYSITTVILQRWYRCASGQSSLDRIVCTCVGYIILISIGSLYLSINKTARPGSTKEILRQQGVFLKVLFFIFLELVIFPTVCGVFLDISTLPLFTEGSIKSRFHFVLLNPYSGLFLHWFVGTGFILQFSVFVALVREVVRPGVLYFMRNPDDPKFHPVQEIVDQPTFLLLKKLLTTAITYFMLISVGMGVFTLLVSKYTGICPIMWDFNTPISSLPIDLLAVQFLLPPIMDYIKPRELFKKNVIAWWHIVSRYLRLSSFMFGGRYSEEEGVYIYRKWWLRWVPDFVRNRYHGKRVVMDTEEIQENEERYFRRDGGLMRVPVHDHMFEAASGRSVFVPVDEDNQSYNNEYETTIVYIPPYFKCRIAIFLFLIWMTGSILVCTIAVVLLKLGRNLFEKVQLEKDKPVHDLYSFTLGAFMMMLMSLLLNTIVHKYQIIERNHGQMNWVMVKNYLLEKTKKAIKFSYLLLTFGFLIPFLIGIMFDLYLFMPIRLSNVHEGSIDLYLAADWTIGITGLSIFYSIAQIIPVQSVKDRAVQFNWNNIDNLNTWNISRQTIFPIIMVLGILIFTPSLMTKIAILLLSVDNPAIKLLMFQCAYPILFCGVCCIVIVMACIRLIKAWIHSIRDNTYLIGKRLHNLEEL
ncbi:MAG: hypothetical protein EXX96DRAFT_547588 [Benjaminiella poitrasii]|nr:MAG: hypothetical protein EXX96DRAFT_547588 [Benjaminiella poitrasii]